MSLTAKHLMNHLSETGESLVLVYSSVTFRIAIHSNYSVERLSVHAYAKYSDQIIQRIFIGDTPIRDIAKHIGICSDNLSRAYTTYWVDILCDLSDIIEKYKG